MTSVQSLREQFIALHHGPDPLLIANAYDAGSARILQSLGYQAIATTSSGFAATLGRLDGAVTRDESIGHGDALAEAVTIPVSADLEHCFADDPAGVAETIRLAAATGLAGGSIEDCSGTENGERHIYDIGLATERVAAAAEVAKETGFVLTARAENHFRGNPSLADTIERLQRYQEAGADVLFAPGISSIDDIKTLVAAVDRPVNVLAVGAAPNVAELAEAGVRRISVGGLFAYAAYAGLVEAATELIEKGTYGFQARAAEGGKAARAAFA
ncbi:MAG TPA: isocitrate lyase/phosphoenolpyruvate mutase family protein [Acidimicrobiales bacterium]|nr:isocitrate lyase/phosphoenolpyruvate mutase family protein [Acidimicrobiales bacterium]